MNDEPSVQVVNRAFCIMEALSNCSKSITLAEVSALTGISKSTAFRILKSLKENGYVSQNPYGQYSLTLKVCNMSRKVLAKMDIVSLAMPHIKRLFSVAHQPVNLIVREGNEIVYVYRQESSSAPFQIQTSVVGQRRYMHTCAAGKSILAELPDEEILAYWDSVEKPQITPYTITTLDGLMKDIREIREKAMRWTIRKTFWRSSASARW